MNDYTFKTCYIYVVRDIFASLLYYNIILENN